MEMYILCTSDKQMRGNKQMSFNEFDYSVTFCNGIILFKDFLFLSKGKRAFSGIFLEQNHKIKKGDFPHYFFFHLLGIW